MGRIGQRNKREQSSELSGPDIIHGFCERTLLRRTVNKVYPNFYLGAWECDILEITKAGYTYEYEVKVSRRDFNIDSLKRRSYGSREKKYDVLRSGKRVNYFSYIVPEGLISPEDVPDFAGLIYARGYERRIYNDYPDDYTTITGVLFETVKSPKRLKPDKITPEELEAVNHKLYFRYHQLRCKLIGKKLETPFTN